MSKIILCADDSVTMQTVAEITLRASAYTFVGARSADEALSKARERKPALVLADAVMPGKTGYDLCQALKSDAAFADVPVIVLCGNSQAYDSARGTAVGADGHLTKPWDTQVLLDKIAEILERVAASGVARPGVGGSQGATPSPAPPAPSAVSTPTTPPVRPVAISTPAVSTPLNAPKPVTPAAVASASAASAQNPPRSATIMGMPTIAMPPGGLPGAAVPVGAKAAPSVPASIPAAPAPAAISAPIAAPATKSPSPATNGGRTPMISGAAAKKSQLVERVLAAQTARLIREVGLDPNGPEILAIARISAEVIERVVWEVVPDLAEAIIRENLDRLVAARR